MDAARLADDQARAYAERTRQLHDARGALAEATSTLRAELTARREEAAAQRQALAEAQARCRVLEAELDRLEKLVWSLRNLKVVRWTAGPRGAVYRLRARLR